jgi:hypothetical protein
MHSLNLYDFLLSCHDKTGILGPNSRLWTVLLWASFPVFGALAVKEWIYSPKKETQ